jgi:multidrug efflux pump subunit AcrA (membrane-fusion protein)
MANDELDTIEDSLSALSDGSTVTTWVQSHNYATVKAVHVTAGASVADVMAEHGALVVLELVDGGEMSIKISEGTVSKVYVKEGRVVYNGTYLFALTSPEVTQTAEELEAQRAEKLAWLETLSTLLYEPTLYSDAAGTVSSVLLTEGQDFTATDGIALQLISPSVVQLSLTIDELDIATVEQGQEVSVEIEALPGETCAGTVIEVSNTPTVSGGNASYPVTVSFERPEGCLAGMSATATIVKERKDDVLLIPLAAVQEYGDSVYVYTSVDEAGNLGGETLIETGLSDGTTAEVTSGLAEGTTVYYRQQSSSTSQGQFTFGTDEAGMMGGGPTMSNSGERPAMGGGGTGAPAMSGGGATGAP